MKTSRGSLLERLYQVGSMECTICHDIETLQFYQADLQSVADTIKIVKEDPKADLQELDAKVEMISFQIEKRKEIIKEETEVRRELMQTLEGLSERDWCSVKHYAEVVSRALEIYQSTWSDEDYSHLIKVYKIWAMKLSLYFDISYTTCFRCLSDKLKS